MNMTLSEVLRALADHAEGKGPEVQIKKSGWAGWLDFTGHIYVLDHFNLYEWRLKPHPMDRCCCYSTTGWTMVKCCNICGMPIPSESWRINWRPIGQRCEKEAKK